MSIRLNDRTFRRRGFLRVAATAIASTGVHSTALTAAPNESTCVPLGLDGHSLRGMKRTAPQLIEFAAE